LLTGWWNANHQIGFRSLHRGIPVIASREGRGTFSSSLIFILIPLLLLLLLLYYLCLYI
jgi:hypothetical protein